MVNAILKQNGPVIDRADSLTKGTSRAIRIPTSAGRPIYLNRRRAARAQGQRRACLHWS